MTANTKAEDIFGSLVGALENVGVDWACATSVATDGAPLTTIMKAGVEANLKAKVHTANGGIGFFTFYCIIHEEKFCCKSLKMEHVMEVVKTVNLIRDSDVNHRYFDNTEKSH